MYAGRVGPSFWQHNAWLGGKCKECQNAPPGRGRCYMNPARAKCGRCRHHRFSCVFDTPEETAAAHNPQTWGPTQTNAFGELRWDPHDDAQASKRQSEDASFCLIRIEITARAKDLTPSMIIWRMEYHLVEGVRKQWCINSGLEEHQWRKVHLFCGGAEFRDQDECGRLLTGLLRTDGGKSWLEATVEAEVEGTDYSSSPSAASYLQSSRRDDTMNHTIQHPDNGLAVGKHGGECVGISEESDNEDGDGDMRSDDTVQEKVIVTVASILFLSNTRTLELEPFETVHHVMKKWYKEQSSDFQYKRSELWLVCGNHILQDNTFCKDILSQAQESCRPLHAVAGVEKVIPIGVMTYDEVQFRLDLQRRTVDVEIKKIENEHRRRNLTDNSPSVRQPTIEPTIEPETEPATVLEPCNGTHTLVNWEHPAVKLIVSSRMSTITPMTFHRRESQEASQLLASWIHLHPDLTVSKKDLVLIQNGNVLEFFATWSSISKPQHRWTNEDEKSQAKPIYLEVMTKRMFETLAAEKKERTARFAEGLQARGGRPTPVLGKRRRESFRGRY